MDNISTNIDTERDDNNEYNNLINSNDKHYKIYSNRSPFSTDSYSSSLTPTSLYGTPTSGLMSHLSPNFTPGIYI
jgi:hypothetical protein